MQNGAFLEEQLGSIFSKHLGLACPDVRIYPKKK